jgi:hypothetical protein
MDARLSGDGIPGLGGDAHSIRNAGGIVSDDAIHLLVISQRLPGTRERPCPHPPPDCDMLSFGDDQVKATVEAETGLTPLFALHAFVDLDRGVRLAVARIRGARWCRTSRRPRLRLRGCRGRLAEVLDANAGPSGVIDFEPHGTTRKPIGTRRSSTRRRP